MAPTQLYRVRPASRSTDNAEELFRARQDLISHLACCEKVSGDPATDRLIMAIAGYASTLVKHGLISRAALQDPEALKQVVEVHVTREATVRELRARIKGQRLPFWRKTASSLLLSLTKKLGRFEV
jgi:hypothetical protein